MPNRFRGNCPICGQQLLVEDEHPDIASCYCSKGHYSCQATDFNRLWDEFDARVRQLGLEKASAAHSEKLLRDLRALNTVKRVKVR